MKTKTPDTTTNKSNSTYSYSLLVHRVQQNFVDCSWLKRRRTTYDHDRPSIATKRKPSNELEDFLSKQTKPIVYVGFGSMSFLDNKKIINIVVPAIQQLGYSCIICAGLFQEFSQKIHFLRMVKY